MSEVASKAVEAAKPAVANGAGKADDIITVLAEADSCQGRLTMKGNGQLLGSFQGEVDCEGELLIGRDAQVVADIRTRNIVVAGLVRGNVTAAGRMRIASSGRLEGDARVGSLIVQEGGVHHGAIRVHPEGVPSEEEPVRPAAPAARSHPGEETGRPGQQAQGGQPGQPARIQVSVDRVKRLWGELF